LKLRAFKYSSRGGLTPAQEEYDEEPTPGPEYDESQYNDETKVPFLAKQDMQPDLDAEIISGIKGLSLEGADSNDRNV